MNIRAFITHKEAERYEDCQDAFTINCETKSIAVSDGMSQSIFPQYWAESLSDAFTRDESWNCTNEQIASLQQKWQMKANSYLKEEKEKGKNPWMLENCLNQKKGAGATFCGIRLFGDQFRGRVLGDTCLFVVSADNKIIEFYKTPKGDFDNHPDYFDSFGIGKGVSEPIDGSYIQGQKLMVVTDPIGELLYHKKQQGKEEEIISQILFINTHEEYCRMIDYLRKSEGMHNDDSTLVIVENDGEKDFNVIYKDDIRKLIKEGATKSFPMFTEDVIEVKGQDINKEKAVKEQTDVEKAGEKGSDKVNNKEDKNEGKADNDNREEKLQKLFDQIETLYKTTQRNNRTANKQTNNMKNKKNFRNSLHKLFEQIRNLIK